MDEAIPTAEYVRSILNQDWATIDSEINRGVHLYYCDSHGLACIVTAKSLDSGEHSVRHAFLNRRDCWRSGEDKDGGNYRHTPLVQLVEELIRAKYEPDIHVGDVMRSLGIRVEFSCLRKYGIADWGKYDLLYGIRKIRWRDHRKLKRKYGFD